MTSRTALLLTLTLAACAPKFTVTSFSDAAVPLPAGATWAWGHPEQTFAAERDRLANDPEVYRIVTAAVEREAGLVVDLFDRASNRLGWRGFLKTRIEQVAETYEGRERNLNDATRRAMKDLPRGR